MYIFIAIFYGMRLFYLVHMRFIMNLGVFA